MATKREKKPINSSLEQLKKTRLVIEDLMYAFQRVRPEQLHDAIGALDQLLMTTTSTTSAVARSYQSTDPNKHFLIGALPRLLLDRDLFPANEDIVDFAKAALRLEMTKTTMEKRARHELIGKIVCETETLDEKQLTDLVRALERLVGNRDRLAVMIEKKKSGNFSWNETLQELLQT